MIPIKSNWLQRLLPNNCILCKDKTNSHLPLCQACINYLPWRTQACCSKCGLSLTSHHICGQCLASTPYFSSLVAPFNYEEPIERFIHQIKFCHKLIHINLLANLFSEHYLTLDLKKPDLIIPVPLHNKRLQQRGFNQAGELAKIIAKQLNIQTHHHLLKRCKHTQAQAQIKQKQREQNLKDAFRLTKPIAAKHVAIIDDVITTGATLNEISRVLYKNGVTRIEVWCIARTQKNRHRL